MALTSKEEKETAIELVAPPDTRMIFQVVWIGDEQIGIVQYLRGSDLPIAFRSFKPSDVRIRSSQDLGCDGSTSIPLSNPEPTATVASRPVIVVATPQSPSSSRFTCAGVVAMSTVDSWRIGETDAKTVDAYVKQFNTYQQPGSTFAKGDLIPAGAIIATSFDISGQFYATFDVKPIVNRGNYGIFKTTREYPAPNEGACIFLDISNVKDNLNCDFINELLAKSQVEQVLTGGKGAAGVQARLLQPVDVPIGWTVHNQGVTYQGPVRFEASTFASFWAPNQCEPLSISVANSSSSASTVSKICTGKIARVTVNSWSTIGEVTTPKMVEDHLNSKFYVLKSGVWDFTDKDKIPAGVLIATDFGGRGETTIWRNYPLKLVIAYRSYGLFETTGEFTVPAGVSGQCLSIAP